MGLSVVLSFVQGFVCLLKGGGMHFSGKRWSPNAWEKQALCVRSDSLSCCLWYLHTPRFEPSVSLKAQVPHCPHPTLRRKNTKFQLFCRQSVCSRCPWGDVTLLFCELVMATRIYFPYTPSDVDSRHVEALLLWPALPRQWCCTNKILPSWSVCILAQHGAAHIRGRNVLNALDSAPPQSNAEYSVIKLHFSDQTQPHGSKHSPAAGRALVGRAAFKITSSSSWHRVSFGRNGGTQYGLSRSFRFQQELLPEVSLCQPWAPWSLRTLQ